MPLIHGKSKEAFDKNIEIEVHQGHKPVKQAVAIAYSEKREAEKREGNRHNGQVQFPAESGHHVGPSSAELNDSLRKQVDKMMKESSASKYLKDRG